MRMSDIMGNMDLSVWPQLALVLFASVFVAVLVKLLRRSTATQLREIARSAIEDGVVVDATPASARVGSVSTAVEDRP